MKRINFYVSDEIYEWLRKEAFKQRITMSKFIRDRLLPETKLKKDILEARLMAAEVKTIPPTPNKKK